MPKGQLELQFLGCGDAFGSGGRLQTCFHLRGDDLSVLIDCGASSLAAIKRQGVDPLDLDAIFISHLHGDHFGGLPFFLLDAEFSSRRKRPLVVAGPREIEARTREAQEVLFPGSSHLPTRFELRFVELEEGREQEVAGLRVQPFEVLHAPGCTSYALRFRRGAKVLAYSGDTQWTDVLLEVARSADLFVCECYRYEPGVPNHLDYATLLARRDELGCRRMVLTHMHDDMLKRQGLELELAADGLVIAF